MPAAASTAPVGDETGPKPCAVRNYKHLKHATKEEWEIMGSAYSAKVDNAASLTNTFFEMLEKQKTFGALGSPVDLYTHNLQTAVVRRQNIP